MKLSCNLLVLGVLLSLATSALAGPIPTQTPTATPTSTPTATPIATPTSTPTATPTGTPGCDLEVEINALRGGSPTVTVGETETKKITAKARIVKGTAARGTTIHTKLQIEVIDDTGVIQTRTSCPYRLEVGKGGQGATLDMLVRQCVGGSVRFQAMFFANENEDCSKPVCSVATRGITKTCN